MGFLDSSVLLLSGFVLLISQLFCGATSCSPPDFPENGRYHPEKAGYEAGMQIQYFCFDSRPMYDENNNRIFERKFVTCQSSGNWSERTPICDIKTKLKNPITSSTADSNEFIVNDGKLSTCFQIRNDSEETLRFSFDRKATPYGIRICFGEGEGKYNIQFDNSGIYTYDTDTETHQCMYYNAARFYSYKTESITVKILPITNNSIAICEIEVYAKDANDWCGNLPEHFIPNGQLEVGRIKAVLHCNEGFREKYRREIFATCKRKKWSIANLQCVDAVSQKDNKSLACPPPDFPERGTYSPQKAEYEEGTKITYSCNDQRQLFFGEIWIGSFKTVTCKSSGKWSGVIPFCSSPAKIRLRNPTTTSKELILTDGKFDTCYRIPNGTEELLEFSLERKTVVYGTEIYLGNGKSIIKQKVSEFMSAKFVDKKELQELSHIVSNFPRHDDKTENVTIQIFTDKKTSVSLCEISVFGKEDNWCEPPKEKSVPNGQLEIGRSKVILHCNNGFKEKHGRPVYATCTNSKWSFESLQCIEFLCDSLVSNVSLVEGEWESDSNTSGYSEGTKRTLKCKPGYHSEGTPLSVTCDKTGTWTTTTAICKKILCHPTVSNMSLSEGEWESDGNISEYSVGSKKTLKCKPGYHSEGTPLTVICQGNGTWLESTAICKSDKSQKDHTFLVVVLVFLLFIIILILVGVKILIRKRYIGLYIIFKSGRKNGPSPTSPAGGQSKTSLSEAEHSTAIL